MYFLEEKSLKPQLLLLSILFVPTIIALILAICLMPRMALLILIFIITCIYLTLAFVLYKASKRKCYYLTLHDNEIEIIFPNINKGKNKLNLRFCEIIEFEYYRITSLKGWLMLLSYLTPKCMFVTYISGNERITDFIGYLDLADAKYIASKCEKNIQIH